MRRCVQCGQKFGFRPGPIDLVDRCGRCESTPIEEPQWLVFGFAILIGLVGAIVFGCLWIAVRAIFR